MEQMLLKIWCYFSITFPSSLFGGLCMNMKVTYSYHYLCVLRGTSVDLPCKFTIPHGLMAKKAFWTIHPLRKIEPPNLSSELWYRGRVHYLGDKYHYCTLRLNSVRKEDELQKYYFMFITKGERWLGDPGVELGVTDLHVEVPEEALEKMSATLTCTTTCSLTHSPTFIWYKNGRPLYSSTNQLHLRSVSSEDAGSYSCAVRGYEHLPSPAQTLTVRYPPKNVSVSISPSGEIVEGSSVSLTCSSDANPPVQNYTWFKGNTLVGQRETYNIDKIHAGESKYTCLCSNNHGHWSQTVTLSVLYPPKNVSVSISPSGEIVEGSSVTLTCSSDANPPVQNYTWFKEGGTSPVGSGQSYTIINITAEHTGLYYCVAQNEHGAQNSSDVSVIIKGSSILPYINAGVSVCGLTALLVLVFWMRKKRSKWKTYKNDCKKCGSIAASDCRARSLTKNTDPDSTDVTYTALELKVTSSDHMYDIIATIHPTCPDAYTPTCPDVYTPTCPDVYTPTCPDVYTPTCPDVYTPTCPDAYTPTCPDVYTPTCPEYENITTLRKQCKDHHHGYR